MSDPTPDLIDALEAVAEEAKTTQERLDRGEAVKGTAGLWRIRNIANDALYHAREREQERTAA